MNLRSNFIEGPCNPSAAEGVLEDVHLDPGFRALGESLGELPRDAPVVPDEVPEGDRAARGTDRRQHRRENLRAVLQK